MVLPLSDCDDQARGLGQTRQGVSVGDVAGHGRRALARGGLEREQHLLARLLGEGLQRVDGVAGRDVEAVTRLLSQGRTGQDEDGGGRHQEAADGAAPRFDRHFVW
jgi:hypothetical protein